MLSRADGLHREQCRADLKCVGDHPFSVRGSGQQACGGVGEDDVRLRPGEIHRDQWGAPDGGSVDGVKADAVGTPGGHQDDVGRGRIDHPGSGPGEHRGVAAADSGDGDIRVEASGGVVDRECGGALALDEGRQQFIAGGSAAAGHQCGDGEIDRAEKWSASQCGAELLDRDGLVHQGPADAAIGFGYRHSQHAEFGSESEPHGGVIGDIGFHQRAHCRLIEVVGAELAHRGAQFLLLGGEAELSHGVRPSTAYRHRRADPQAGLKPARRECCASPLRCRPR